MVLSWKWQKNWWSEQLLNPDWTVWGWLYKGCSLASWSVCYRLWIRSYMVWVLLVCIFSLSWKKEKVMRASSLSVIGLWLHSLELNQAGSVAEQIVAEGTDSRPVCSLLINSLMHLLTFYNQIFLPTKCSYTHAFNNNYCFLNNCYMLSWSGDYCI